MNFANMSMRPDIELPEPEQECPPDVHALIEENHQGLHRILISRRKPNGGHETFGTIVCQKTKDRFARPEATPEELGELCMMWIQYDIYRTDDPGNYRVLLVGPPGKGKFERSTHINMMGEGGIPRTMAMLNQGDLLESQTLYIGEMHSQVIGMIEILIGGYKTVVNENREMMKILSEATRKHGEIEAMRLEHQLNMKMHEDDKQHQEAESERSMKKWEQGLGVLRETGAAEDLMRAIARRIESVKKSREEHEVDETKPPTEETVNEPTADYPAPEKKTRFASGPAKKKTKKKTKKKATKKGSRKKSSKKKSSRKKSETPPKMTAEEAQRIEDDAVEEFLEEGAKLIEDRPLVLAAETLKMTINQKGQWAIIRKTLTEEQADILDDIFASQSDEDVKKNAQRLASAKGMFKLMELREHLDEQQTAFIEMVMAEVKI